MSNQNNVDDPLSELLAKAKLISNTSNTFGPSDKTPVPDPPPDKKKLGVGWLISGLIFLILYFVFKAWVVQLLWNWFIPAFFGLPQLNVVKGLVLLLLSEVLFKQTIVDLSDLATDDFKKIQMRKATDSLIYVLILGSVCRLILFGSL